MIRYYVAATSQHVGKTTSTLGLVKSFKTRGFNVGYSKPVGQKALLWKDQYIDKDAILFANSMGFELEANVHSPVILGPGATTQYLDHPTPELFNQRILDAAAILESRHQAIIYEGTGHPGVGSVVGLSNAKVAKLLNAHVILVVEGGIGSTIDELNMSGALFREQEVPIAGVIVNKIKPEKLEKVKEYLEKYLAGSGIPVLGYLPYEGDLANPIMETISHSVQGEVIYNQDSLDRRVEHIMAGSLINAEEITFRKNILLVSSSNRLGTTLRKLIDIQRENYINHCPLAGIIITGDGMHASRIDIPAYVESYIQDNKVPVISTLFDTYGSAIKISRIEVKINMRTPWKVNLAEKMIHDHVDLDRLFSVPVKQK